MQTFQECFDAKMTAYEAADHLGKSAVAAYKWANRNGLKWASMTPAERARRMREGIAKSGRKVRYHNVNGMGEKRDDRLALPPEQERESGGRFVMVNHKTGQRLRRGSERSCYLTAMILGWTDYDYGVANDL